MRKRSWQAGHQRNHWSCARRKGRLRQGTGRSPDQPAGVAANGNRGYSAYHVRGPRAIDRAQAERFTSQAIGVLTHFVLPQLFNEAKEGLMNSARWRIGSLLCVLLLVVVAFVILRSPDKR